MKKLTLSLITATAAAALSLGTPLASASPPPAGVIVVPMSSKFRACDFTDLRFPGSRGTAQALGRISTTGSGTVVATVDIVVAKPNTRYDVRLIQVPRPSIGCAPGAPGVASGHLQTDAFGAATIRLEGPIESGATGAWVTVERPAPFAQTPVEFYTSGFVADF